MSTWDEDAPLIDRWLHAESDEERKAAARELYLRHVRAVIGFLRNKVASDRLDDFVQETFSRAFAAIKTGTLRDPKAFRSFVIGVALHCVRAYNRKISRESEFDPERHATEDVSPGPFSFVAEKEEQRILLKALRRIPFQSQVLLELAIFQGLEHRRIAEILPCKKEDVRRKVYVAREGLKAVIRDLKESPRMISSTLGDIEGWAAGVREQLGLRDDSDGDPPEPEH